MSKDKTFRVVEIKTGTIAPDPEMYVLIKWDDKKFTERALDPEKYENMPQAILQAIQDMVNERLAELDEPKSKILLA